MASIEGTQTVSVAASGQAVRNATAFLLGPGLIAMIIAAWVAAFPPDFAHPSQAAALQIATLAPIVLLGAAGVYVSIRSGMTPDPLVAGRGRGVLLAALISGAILGLVVAGLDLATGFSDLIARRLGIDSIHIDFPASALVYSAGAVAVECLYRLIPVSALYFLIAALALRGRREAAVFWSLAVLTSSIEPLSQAGLAGDGLLVGLLFAFIFAFNIMEATLWRRYGWTALLVSRLTFYFIWHVAVGPAL